jgi:hypothetical protein
MTFLGVLINSPYQKSSSFGCDLGMPNVFLILLRVMALEYQTLMKKDI